MNKMTSIQKKYDNYSSIDDKCKIVSLNNINYKSVSKKTRFKNLGYQAIFYSASAFTAYVVNNIGEYFTK